MLEEISFHRLLAANQGDSRIVLANLEDSKFVFVLEESGKVAVVSDRNGENQTIEFSLLNRQFLRVSSDATTIVFTHQRAQQQSESFLGRLLKRGSVLSSQNLKYDLLNVNRLTWTTICLDSELSDVIERPNGHLTIALKNRELVDYNVVEQSFSVVSVLDFEPLKMIAWNDDLVLVSEEEVVKMSGTPETVKGRFNPKLPIDSCFIYQSFLVYLSSKDKSFALEVLDLNTMKVQSSKSVNYVEHETVDLHFGVVPFVNWNTGQNFRTVVLTRSRLTEGPEASQVGTPVAQSTDFCFYQLSNLKKLFLIPTNYTVENRNLFLADAWLADNAPGMRGAIANYNGLIENKLVIEAERRKTESLYHMAAIYMSLRPNALLNRQNFLGFKQLLGSDLPAEFYVTVEANGDPSAILNRVVLPMIETALSSQSAKQITDIMTAKRDGNFIFEDEGEFFQHALAGLFNKFVCEFIKGHSLSEIAQQKTKLSNLLSVALTYSQIQRLYALNSGKQPKEEPLEVKFRASLTETEALIRLIKRQITTVKAAEFLLLKNSGQTEHRNSDSVEGMEVESQSEKSDFGVKTDFNSLFNKMNKSMDEKTPNSPKAALSQLDKEKRSKSEYYAESVSELRPVLMIESLASESGKPLGIESVEDALAVLSDPITSPIMRVSLILYYFIASGNERMVAQFASTCDLNEIELANARALVLLDQLVRYSVKNASNNPAEQLPIYSFLLAYRPTMNSKASNANVLKLCSVLNERQAVAALLSTEMNWEQEIGFEALVKLLVLNNLTSDIPDLVGRSGENKQQKMFMVVSELKKAGLDSKLSNEELSIGLLASLSANDLQEEKKQHLVELIKKEAFQEAGAYWRNNWREVPSPGLHLSFILAVIAKNLFPNSDFPSGLTTDLFDVFPALNDSQFTERSRTFKRPLGDP